MKSSERQRPVHVSIADDGLQLFYSEGSYSSYVIRLRELGWRNKATRNVIFIIKKSSNTKLYIKLMKCNQQVSREFPENRR